MLRKSKTIRVAFITQVPATLERENKIRLKSDHQL